MKKELLLIVAILALGAFFRFYHMTTVPPGLYPDEAMNGNNALETLANTDFSATGGPTLGWKVFYPENNGREGLFINIQALSIWMFGPHPWALRVVSVVFGTLTILALWLLGKELFRKTKHGEYAALLASLFLAVSYWHINFSRIGFRAITVPFFATFGLYFLLKALRRGTTLDALWAGVFIGLGFHTYIAFRFMPFALAVPIGVYLWRWWKNKNLQPTAYDPQPRHCIPCAVTLFLFVTFVVALPIGWYFLNHPADFLGRGGQVSVFSAERPLSEFVKSNALTLQMFFWRGDCNPRHNLDCLPELNVITQLFFLVGAFFIVRRLFREKTGFEERLSAAVIASLFFFMLFPVTLTREGIPHALRAIGLIPPVFLTVGWGAAAFWGTIWEKLQTLRQNPEWKTRWGQLKRVEWETKILLAGLIFFSIFQTYRLYFVRFPAHPDTYGAFAVDLVHIGEYLNTLPNDAHKIVVINLSGDLIRGVRAPAQTPMFITDTFREEEQTRKRITYVNSLEEIVVTPGEKTAIIPLNGHDKTLFREIKTRYPELQGRAPGDFLSFQNF